MSGFEALEALAFLDAFSPFFLGELFNMDRVDIHGIWVDFGTLVVGGVIPLNRIGVVRFLVGDGVCSVPLGFKNG